MTTITKNMHNLFNVSKTLKFELKPIGATNNKVAKIVQEDEYRAKKFKRVKKYADEVHKAFIDSCLRNINKEAVAYYFGAYAAAVKSKNEKETENIMNAARKVLADSFQKNKQYKFMFGKELIRDILPEVMKGNKEAIADIADFNDFTTYLTDYNISKKNMYVNEPKSTAIVYRLVHQNLPSFIRNIENFRQAVEAMPDLPQEIKRTLDIDTDVLFSKAENYVNFMAQSDIERYNLAISGLTEKGNSKIKGINEYINLYNQQNKSKLPKLNELYKQILSDRSTASFVIEKIEKDAEAIDCVKSIYEAFKRILDSGELSKTICCLDTFNLDKIYVNNDLSLSALSKAVYGDWSFIGKLREKEYDARYTGKTKKDTEKYDEMRRKMLKKVKTLSLQFIENCVSAFAPKNDDGKEKYEGMLTKYFEDSFIACVTKIDNCYNSAISVLNKKYDEKSNIADDDNSVKAIKGLLDSMKDLQMLVKTLIPKDQAVVIDDRAYNSFSYETLCEIIPVYNKVRNYLTKKPYSEDKFKLNFECGALLGGWAKSVEQNYRGVMLFREGKYYLGIIAADAKGKTKIFNDELCCNDNSDCYVKMDYYQISNPSKDLPHVFLSKKGKAKYNLCQELLDGYTEGKHKVGEKFDINFCHKYIDFCKKAITENRDYDVFDFNFSPTSSYTNLNDFYLEVSAAAYKLQFRNFSTEYINKLVTEGQLYLFEIYNKDFSPSSTGKPNLFTMYFKALFDAENLKLGGIYRLNGGAEVFYRRKSIERKATHCKGLPIKQKRNIELTSTYQYDLYKDKRYTEDKFFLHVPISMNCLAQKKRNINSHVNDSIRDSNNLHVIGIDRGERNLLYYSVIDFDGNIIEQGSLNDIKYDYKSATYVTDYNKKLSEISKENEKAQKEWRQIANITALKNGYLSLAINELVKKILKYNAVIVLEDLNSGFINSRKKIEKSVYSKFETALISKLSYLVNKNTEAKFAEGGVYNAYQLASTDLAQAYQNGILFYIPAWNTSKIDPTTGFVNMFKLQDVTSEATGKEFVAKFKDIRYNGSYFEFDIDYADFSDKVGETRRDWTICSYGQRIRTFRNPAKNSEWDNEEIELTAEFMKLFARYNINLNNIQTEIAAKADSKFFKSEGQEGFIGFMRLFKLMTQLRNSVTKSDIDYILSPVKNARGEFFDTRKGNENLPLDADANGAYNIARKGLMLLDRIRSSKPDEKIAYGIKNSEWLKYVQSQDR